MTTFTQYLFEHPERVWPRFVEHLSMSVVALLIALVISLPLGLLLNRIRPLRNPVLFVLDMVYTIPSFALFALLVPVMGLGPQPAVTALACYSLFILVRNTMVGYDGVDPAVKEAAQGMGMSRRQVLWRIETPLALPVIIAGIRIATLSTVGLATIAAWIGAGGLGQLLRDGLGNLSLEINQSKLYAGLICIGAIALAADLLFRFIERQVAAPSG
jgi:osmoprotectant transport system permease protein